MQITRANRDTFRQVMNRDTYRHQQTHINQFAVNGLAIVAASDAKPPTPFSLAFITITGLAETLVVATSFIRHLAVNADNIAIKLDIHCIADFLFAKANVWDEMVQREHKYRAQGKANRGSHPVRLLKRFGNQLKKREANHHTSGQSHQKAIRPPRWPDKCRDKPPKASTQTGSDAQQQNIQ